MAEKKPWELNYGSAAQSVQSTSQPNPPPVSSEKPWEQMYRAAPEPTPASSERMRSLAQGLTFGGADEAEAWLRSLGGEDYDKALADIRAKLKAYRGAQPWESLAYEAGGAALPSIAALIASGGSAGLALFPQLARLPQILKIGGLGTFTGGLTGALSSEQEGINRLRDVPVSAAIGTVTGPAAYLGFKAIGSISNGVVDFARRAMGNRGAKAVETEIQRMADASGQTVDEIVERIARGEIMAENETLRAAVRGFYTQGGQASQTLADTLKRRPSALREQTMSELQKGMTPGTSGNILEQARLDDDAIRLAERSRYQSAFEQGGIVTEPLLDSFSTAMRRSPKAAAEISEYYRAQSGNTPFFKVLDDGTVQYSRTPTLRDMEIVRRGLQEQVDVAYRSGRGATGEAFKDLETELRAQIDVASPAVAGARRQAKIVRDAREAFQEGRRALSMSADEVEVMFSRMDEGQIRAFRSGLMDALRARATTGSRNTLISSIADPTRKEGQILRTVFPGDQLDKMLELAGLATRSQQAASTIMGGSPTAANLAEQAKIGSRISAEEILQFGTSPIATMRVVGKLVNSSKPNLTESQRQRVAQVLISEDADLVRRALQDNSLMAKVQQRINTISDTIATGAATAGAYTPPARMQ